MQTEKQLLQGILDGDRRAFRQLYDRYSGYAMAVGLRYIHDEAAVEDVLQDSFLKVFSHIGSFDYRGEGSLKVWIMKIVANESLTYLRKNSRFVLTDEVQDEPYDDEPQVELVPKAVLTEMISRLPVGYRVVLNLYVFGQMSHKEIAQELGIKENSSASQYARAKQSLAKMIGEYLKKENR